MKSLEDLNLLKQQIAQCGQKQYDLWEQDSTGYDHEVGYGGICHLIADEIVSLLDRHRIESFSYSLDTEVHVLVVCKLTEGVFFIDIPHRFYERGGGYTWKKIPNVIFESDMVSIDKISSDPDEFENYSD